MFRKIFICALLIVFILGMPYALVALLDSDIINFKLGSNNTWITFWGSYIGAIVSASAVYFVARFQMKKQYDQQMELFKLQNKQQIQSIELENKHSTKREMKKFYLMNRMEKTEEMLVLLEKLSSFSIDLNNDLVTFCVIKNAKDRGLAGSKHVDNDERIYQLRTNFRKHHFEISKTITRLVVLSEYIKVSHREIMDIQKTFFAFFNEVKSCYYSNDLYKQYLMKADTENPASQNYEIIAKKIVDLSVYTLHEDLSDTLGEIEKYVK